MIEKYTHFAVPDELGIEELKTRLGAELNCQEEPDSVRTTTVYYDSFDGRLHKAGDRLASVSGGTGRFLQLQLNEEAPQCLDLPGMPRFAGEFPDPVLRERLAAVLDIRALLPQVQIEQEVHTLRVLNRDIKTVARLQVETNHCRDPESDAQWSLGSRVVLLPARGYDKVAKRLRRHLSRELGLQPAVIDLLPPALEAMGRRLDAYSTRLNGSFGPRELVAQAARQILRQVAETLEANVPGARADLDSEFLHDLRIAVRRTRSALGEIPGVFPAGQVARFRELFGWIGQVTGPTRDLDVYLLNFPGYRDRLPEDERGALEPLHEFLIAHHQTEQATLAEHLASPHFREILEDWHAFLDTPDIADPALGNATRYIGDLASERILKMYKRLLREGRGIGPASPPEALHSLRKSGKKLRYLMEFFQHLYPPRRVGRLVLAVRQLLENLGEFQDLEVQAGKLRGFAQQMTEEQRAPEATLAAIDRLAVGLLQQQGKVRQEFDRRFAVLTNRRSRKAFGRLFVPRQASSTA
jgi:CHAD domain-containing protein